MDDFVADEAAVDGEEKGEEQAGAEAVHETRFREEHEDQDARARHYDLADGERGATLPKHLRHERIRLDHAVLQQRQRQERGTRGGSASPPSPKAASQASGGTSPRAAAGWAMMRTFTGLLARLLIIKIWLKLKMKTQVKTPTRRAVEEKMSQERFRAHYEMRILYSTRV